MRRLNYEEAVAVTHEIHWVGCNDAQAGLHCNPYLLLDQEEAVLIDPGSIPDFPVIMRKVIDVTDPGAISQLIISHQDPDVCGNLAVVEDVIDRDDLRIVAHRNTVRLIRHLDPSSKFYSVDDEDFRLTLNSGRVLEFMHTPFLHSPGAIVTYDVKTRSLFSSDIFGAINAEGWNLFAGEDFCERMAPFHQAYMVNNQTLRKCLDALEQRWQIQRILPQHGSIIEGDDVATAFAFLKGLPCGMDLYGTDLCGTDRDGAC